MKCFHVVMAKVEGNERVDTSSNPGRHCLHFLLSENSWDKYVSNHSPSTLAYIVGQTMLFNFGIVTGLRKAKL